MKQAPKTSPMLEAALAFAARGWPVFPCNTANKKPLLAASKDPKTGQKIKGTGGVSRASIHEQEIRTWWKKWPLAMVGLATGHAELFEEGQAGPVNRRLFVLDFDPRNDPETGEEYTLERLKAETEAQIGCALPATLAARTPSGGVHLYYATPDDGGAAIRNRGNLPLHVDVRGLGGYVIAPPSVMEDGRRYRWLHGAADAAIAEAPAALIAELRAPKRRVAPAPSGEFAADQAASAPPSPPPSRPGGGAHPSGDGVDAAVRRYALGALDAECAELARTPVGKRNIEINTSAFRIGQLVGAGALSLNVARAALEDVVSGMISRGGGDYEAGCKTVDNGLTAGMGSPRDLSDIAEAARDRAARPQRFGRSRDGSAPAPVSARPTSSSAKKSTPFQSGRSERDPVGAEVREEPLTAAERHRFARISALWLQRRLERVERTPKALTALAWSAGRRCAADLLDAGDVKEAIWPLCEDVADVQHADIERALDEGIVRGFDPGPLRLTLACAAYPLTDFGVAERFRDRYGADFRFTTGKGWLGWDTKRWKVLDQDKDTPPAELIGAVFDTIRAIQFEAGAVADTGVRWSLIKRKEGRKEISAIDEEDEGNPHGLDRWVPKGQSFILFSEMLRIFGRQCELAGKPAAIAALARRWLTVPIENFDCEQLAVNVVNGTLRFEVETMLDGKRKASVRRDRHRREDLITRLAPVEFDPKAECPLYDGMLEWAQPEAEMRRYLHQIGGYGITGHTGEHKLWYHFGHGRNGKSTTIDSWCSTLGDYSGTIGIESFLDQGIKKRGDQATPDLAKLGGVRMLRASEAERNSKLNSALVKAVTGGEPMSVRALHRGFFDLQPRFKLMMSGNFKPSIPDTDDGIWGRMKLVLWGRHIEKPEEDPFKGRFPENHANWPKKDTDLLGKIKGEIGPGELPGVFNRLVAGLCDYLENGLAEPSSVTAATQAYRDTSDPVARFLRLCTVADPSGRIQSSKLHEVFVAWAKAAGEVGHREWSNKALSTAMEDKGFTKKPSNGMQWLGLRLVRQAEDFVDEHGRVKPLPDDISAEPPNEGVTPIERVTAPPLGPQDEDDDDFRP